MCPETQCEKVGISFYPESCLHCFVNLDTRRKQHFVTQSQFLKGEITARIQNVNVYAKDATVENTAKK